jgi:N-acetylmuramoyl-L-alanine amidase
MLKELHRQFPKALIVGLRNLNPGHDCPCFDVIEAYKDLKPY